MRACVGGSATRNRAIGADGDRPVVDGAQAIVRVPPDANLADQVSIAIESNRLILQTIDGAGCWQIHEDPRGILEPVVMKRHFLIELDDDPHRVAHDRPSNVLDGGDLRR